MRRARPARISLLLADVDGTLVTHDKVLTERTRAAVHRLHEQGIRFAITSGRPPRGMVMLTDPLRIDTAIGADAGALAQRVAVRLVERMNAPPGGFALNLSGGSRRSGSTGSWPPTGTGLTRPFQ